MGESLRLFIMLHEAGQCCGKLPGGQDRPEEDCLREEEVGMSLDQSILHGKEHRKPYVGAKSIDPTCRNHGSCPWCYGSRMYRRNKEESRCEMAMREYKEQQERW